MLKKTCFLLLFIIVCVTESLAAGWKFDELDADISNLSYQVEEEDLDDYAKLLDYNEGTNSEEDTANDKSKTTSKTTGFKTKKTIENGLNKKQDAEREKKFYKKGGEKEEVNFDDDEAYSVAEKAAAKAYGATGNENRTYRKGTKTKGFHRVHHKDEYKKDKEFYEDDETVGSLKKVGAKGFGYRVGAGAAFDKGKLNHSHRKGIAGKLGYRDKASLDKRVKQYLDKQGFDELFTNAES